jgi:hypothetical protein
MDDATSGYPDRKELAAHLVVWNATPECSVSLMLPLRQRARQQLCIPAAVIHSSRFIRGFSVDRTPPNYLCRSTPQSSTRSPCTPSCPAHPCCSTPSCSPPSAAPPTSGSAGGAPSASSSTSSTRCTPALRRSRRGAPHSLCRQFVCSLFVHSHVDRWTDSLSR